MGQTGQMASMVLVRLIGMAYQKTLVNLGEKLIKITIFADATTNLHRDFVVHV